jgi:putative transposase
VRGFSQWTQRCRWGIVCGTACPGPARLAPELSASRSGFGTGARDGRGYAGGHVLRLAGQVAGVQHAKDLVDRDFTANKPNRLWCADITYLPSWEGWLYLASVIDLYSRMIVGWGMAEHMRVELVLGALEMAVARPRPDPGVVHHSDHGSQYTAVMFGDRCEQVGIDISMGSIGDCYDNAVCESFHSTLKRERINRQSWPTRDVLRTAAFEYIEGFYNTTRRHSTLNYLSLAAYEAAYYSQQQTGGT